MQTRTHKQNSIHEWDVASHFRAKLDLFNTPSAKPLEERDEPEYKWCPNVRLGALEQGSEGT